MILELADIRILPGQRAGLEETIARAPSTVASQAQRMFFAQPPRVEPFELFGKPG